MGVDFTNSELEQIRWTGNYGVLFGDETWVEHIVRKYEVESTIRPRDRPRSNPNDFEDTSQFPSSIQTKNQRSMNLTIQVLLVAAISTSTFTLATAQPLAPNSHDGNGHDSGGYIGSSKCVECHREQHASYLETLHSKTASFTITDKNHKPASFIHKPSGHRYSVGYADQQMIHSESLLSGSGETIKDLTFPMSVTLGSGTKSQSYLTRMNDFYIESPITYYSEPDKWAMSPGYDKIKHDSFRREVTTSCVFCHVGSIEQETDNPYKFKIREASIGCERCHGPGEMHVKRHQQPSALASILPIAAGADAIVNPRTLSRELSEAICQQCHCQGVQEISVSGKDDWDFRPGMKLTDIRVDYQLGGEHGGSMSLVGHVEQLHQSKCYTETSTLTCITCHDPHHQPALGDLVTHHRNVCNGCHERQGSQTCSQPHEGRVAKNGNDCAQCHMPRGETDVAHFALHNHRIGIHQSDKLTSAVAATSFSPILDISYLPISEQKRLDGLLKFEIYQRRGGDPAFAKYLMESTSDLIQLKQSGYSNIDVDAALSRLAWEQKQPQIATRLAMEVLNTKTQRPASITATSTLARIYFEGQEYAKAIDLYKILSQLHRDPSDAYFLGLCQQNVGLTNAAIDSLLTSVEIDPMQVAARRALQAIYGSIGRDDDAATQARLADDIEHLQRPE